MDTGNLTPRSNSNLKSFRYTGGFGQPDGFASVLEVKVNTAGDAALTLHYKSEIDHKEHLWGVMLSNDQRKHLASWLGEYDPVLWEEMRGR